MMHITLEKDHTYTITGVPYNDFRHILTAANLHHHETEKEINAQVCGLRHAKPESTEKWLREAEEENITAEKEWAKQFRSLVEELEKLALDAIRAANQRQTEETKEKEIRRRVKAELRQRRNANCTKVVAKPHTKAKTKQSPRRKHGTK